MEWRAVNYEDVPHDSKGLEILNSHDSKGLRRISITAG